MCTFTGHHVENLDERNLYYNFFQLNDCLMFFVKERDIKFLQNRLLT